MTDEDAILAELTSAADPLAAADLARATNISRRTLLRRLTSLIDAGKVAPIGKGRARRYAIVTAPDLASHFSTPHRQRPAVGWQQEFLRSYQPNETFYLPTTVRQELAVVGSPPTTLPAGTYARRILDRLLIDLSWSSSRLEGNTYSLLDTEELLIRGREPEGRTRLETQMVLNHKAAIEFLVENAADVSFQPWVVRNLHALLSEGLLAEPGAGGRLRSIPVEISGSSYIPLANPQRLDEAFQEIIQKAEAIRDPFEASFFALVQIPYLQPFVDVNKRVSRLAANIPFIRGNYYPLSFLETSRDEYLRAVLAVYELRHVDPLAGLFADAYRRSAQKNAVVAQSIGEPDPLRTKYREQLRMAVGHVVRELLPADRVETTPDELGLALDPGDRDAFVALMREELAALHEGNFARYRLRPSEFARWRSR